jgi:hypothetical protein
MTKINQAGAIILKNNQKKGANAIRCNENLFPLIDSLEFFNNQTMMIGGRYNVIIDNQIPEDEIIVYYNGVCGDGEREKKYNYMLIEIKNYMA